MRYINLRFTYLLIRSVGLTVAMVRVGSNFLPRDALECKQRYCDCMSSVRL